MKKITVNEIVKIIKAAKRQGLIILSIVFLSARNYLLKSTPESDRHG